MLANVLRKLDAHVPGIGAWLETELPPLMVSLTVHAAVLVSLALVGHRVHEAIGREFSSPMFDSALNQSDSTFQDLDQSAEPPPLMAAAGSFAPNLAPMVTSATTAGGVPVSTVDPEDASGANAPELSRLDIRETTQMVAPSAMLLGQTISIKGNGAEHVGAVEGAVDRVAVEILRRLEQGRTLVIWAFDASGSLEAERERLGKHIEAIYAHINQLDENHLSADKGLLTLVVAFGRDRKAMTPKPTADLSEIRQAIADVPPDTTGIETTFTTVAEIVSRWGKYKDSAGRPYRPMIIVVTDEVGDDEGRLEEAVSLAQKAKTPVYVLGSQAVFGRTEGYMDYLDPRTKHLFRNVAVRQGPESVMLEQIRLPFWYNGLQYDIVEAGFGPYALSRLASATGGIYFVTRFAGQRMGFDPSRMKEYRPDWVSRARYEEMVAHSPLRQAILNAAQITQQRLPGMPSLGFPSMEDPNFKEVMANNQAVAERTAYTVDEALQPINAVAKLRDRETSRRWQAHYDLIRGRLLAMKVRCYEYNWACARLKKDPPKFKNPKSNAWRLVPDTAIQYSAKAADAAKEAESLLNRVIEEHPETPWALLAQRELKDPLGFKWVETFVPPPRRNDNDAAAPQRKNRTMPQPKPPEPPKL